MKIPDVEGTKTRDGFDVEVAKAAYEEKMSAAANKPAKKSAPKGGDPAVAEKREERMKVLRRWWENEAEYGHDYTSTEVFNALPDIYGIDVNTQGAMLTGRDLAQLAKEGLAEMNMVEKKKCYSIEEYEELNSKFSQLQADFEALSNTKTELEQQVATLTEFKLSVERKEKQSMIERFYMLSDEDKADVIANIDTYSLDDIEAKLSVICVRNKVNFNLDDDRDEHDPMVYSLNNHETDDTPAWVLAVLDTAKTLN